MNHPSDPGRPSQPPGGPYGPPPLPRPGQASAPQAERGQQPPPQQQSRQEWAPPEPAVVTNKGLIGSLLDANFNHLVTPKLIKLWYIVALLLVTLQCTVAFFLGIYIATWDNFWAWGIIMALATPLLWLFEMLMVRIVMEAVVVRFKSAEYLRVIKDKI
ncbi:DUF4282 domain-containing protein [Spirillospora sp. CA-294931]|uniref:DUF4282 domain-containing protein n=1 Tax=Spirillospora sp. CA-294931 TaxID=3240042 RepID=UPI003D8ADBF7